jgi:LmbE family N-acetylglucosaminyl deacetylase
MKRTAVAASRALRPVARNALLAVNLRRRKRATERWLRQSPALVFAPHPDDETLACGGTIARKVAAGADVRVVFMTDGSASHPGVIAPDVLRPMRREEARKAAKALGLEDEALAFLDFPDGILAASHENAVPAVKALLDRHRPRQVFVPYRRDTHRDHDATFRIVHEALQKAGLRAWLFEYPVWLWNHWPWVGLWSTPGSDESGASAGSPPGAYGSALHGAATTLLGLRLTLEFRLEVDIGETLEQKRNALACHVSQVTPPPGRPGGGSLWTINGGEFLRWMDQSAEIFKPSSVGWRVQRGPGRRRRPRPNTEHTGTAPRTAPS